MNQWSIRFKSFGWSLLSMVGTVFGGIVMSEDFRTLITNHFGTSVAAVVCTLIIPEAVKFIRNRYMISKTLGASTPVDLI